MPFAWTNTFMAAPAAHVPLPTPAVTLLPSTGTQKIRLISLEMARSRPDIKYRREGHEMPRKRLHCQLMGYVAGGPYF